MGNPPKLRNPPNIYQIPSTLPYFRQCAVDMAYVTPYSRDETRKHFKRRIYAVLLRIVEAALGSSEPRIVRKHPENNWKHIWTNLHTTELTDTLKSKLYEGRSEINASYFIMLAHDVRGEYC